LRKRAILCQSLEPCSGTCKRAPVQAGLSASEVSGCPAGSASFRAKPRRPQVITTSKRTAGKMRSRCLRSGVSLVNVICRRKKNMQRSVLTTLFAPSGELCPLGGTFTARGELSLLFKKNGGANRELHPQGIISPLGVKVWP
jgi:hypothetical protein